MYSNFNHYKSSKMYEDSVNKEKELIKFYNSLCDEKKVMYRARPATRSEQLDDIDIVVDISGYLHYVSVKKQDKALQTGNLCFEEYNNGRESWFKTGKSTVYAFVVGDTVYQFSTAQLKDYIYRLDAGGKVIRKGLTKAVALTNINPNAEVINILVKLEDLKKNLMYSRAVWDKTESKYIRPPEYYSKPST